MPQTVRELMTDNPCFVELDTPLSAVAQTMRDNDIGDVIVVDGGEMRGILTDRDIVVRALAEGMDPRSTTVDAVYSGQLVTVTPDTPAKEAVRLMREHAVRRLPVTEDGNPIGIVSIGDLAMYRDEDSVLADISAAPPNN